MEHPVQFGRIDNGDGRVSWLVGCAGRCLSRSPSDDRSAQSDDTRSDYDRGHMSASGDMPNPQAQRQSFSLANIVPRTAMPNRNV